MKSLARGVRTLVRHPRYTLLAVLTLAAGIGANAAIFGVLDAVFFRPLPLAEAERLVDVALQSPESRFTMFSYEEFRDIERNVPAFKDAMAIGSRGTTLNLNGEVQRLSIDYVSGRFFPSLGIPMQYGRGLSSDDDRPDATTPRVVINHDLWERLGRPDGGAAADRRNRPCAADPGRQFAFGAHGHAPLRRPPERSARSRRPMEPRRCDDGARRRGDGGQLRAGVEGVEDGSGGGATGGVSSSARRGSNSEATEATEAHSAG